MDNQITFLLGSIRPQDRKKAIHMLTKVGDQEALRALAKLYKNDPDDEIREMAIKAGKYIKLQQTRAQDAAALAAESSPSNVDVEEEEAAEAPEKKFTPVVVSSVNQERAKGMLDRALDLSIRGEEEKAIDSLVKAFKANPNYRLDSYAMGIAMDITRADHAQTLRIVSGEKEAQKAKQAVKVKNDGITDEPLWDTVGTRLIWYYLGMAGLIFIASALLILINKAGFASARDLLTQGCPSCSPEESLRLSELVRNMAYIESMSLLHSFLHGVVGAAILIALLILYHGILYVVSSILFRQSATYHGLMHRTAPSIVITYGIGGVLLAIGVILSSTDTFNPHYMTLVQQKATFSASPVVQGLVLLALVIPFGGNLWLADSIAQYYKGTWTQGRWAAYIAFFFFWFMTIGVGLAIYMTNLRANTPGL
jgi:multisubunit Na+/H+ antiporter MnhC subunit